MGELAHLGLGRSESRTSLEHLAAYQRCVGHFRIKPKRLAGDVHKPPSACAQCRAVLQKIWFI